MWQTLQKTLQEVLSPLSMKSEYIIRIKIQQLQNQRMWGKDQNFILYSDNLDQEKSRIEEFLYSQLMAKKSKKAVGIGKKRVHQNRLRKVELSILEQKDSRIDSVMQMVLVTSNRIRRQGRPQETTEAIL